MPPRARFSGSVTANTRAKSALSPPVMKCLRPDTIQVPLVLMALVWMRVASEPAPGDLLGHVQRPEPQLRGALAKAKGFLLGILEGPGLLDLLAVFILDRA